jgi:hypothetical protein
LEYSFIVSYDAERKVALLDCMINSVWLRHSISKNHSVHNNGTTCTVPSPEEFDAYIERMKYEWGLFPLRLSHQNEYQD